MELVLSAGGAAGDDDAGTPFRNEDVREWSRVDHVTGMLERARVETDRWQADTQDAKQSYGKMSDSRVRNSADGSLVQKARRQVEIFQSQGNGGRNFQVVRASQWSSSRATDCCLPALEVASSNSNTQCIDTMNAEANFNSPRLSLWRSGLADTAVSDLDRLSYLCRKLHDEAMSNASFWPLTSVSPRTPSPGLLRPVLEGDLDDRLSSLLLTNERRSNSNDDLSTSSCFLGNGNDHFTRHCKARRSLQIPNNNSAGENDVEDKADNRLPRRSRAELIAERAKRFEEAVTRDNAAKRSFISTKTFTPIADNDFVKNDPKHPSKLNNQIAKISIQDNAQNAHQRHHNAKTMHVSSLQPQPRHRQQHANNKTVVHLRNAASPDEQPSASPRCINVTAIKLEKDGEPTLMENNRLTDSTTTTALVNGTKPVKRVEFCKTEIHFAADSGKVNIVETDGKPPPTNKFRRRRRNHSLNSAINPQKSNLPVVHFGDTSYEKYIFGGGKVPPPSSPPAVASSATRDENNKTDNSAAAAAAAAAAATVDENFEAETDSRWEKGSSQTRENGHVKEIVTKDSYTDTSLDKVMEHVGKFRGGAHTTTVNFHSGNDAESKGTLAKVAGEGTRTKRAGIQLQFASRSLSPIHSSSDDDGCGEGRVIRTTKITLHLPAPAVHHRQPSINPFSNLKSVRLVMNTMTASQLLDTLYKHRPNATGPELWSLKLKQEDDDDDGDARILDESRMIEDKPSSNYSLPTSSKDSDQVLLKVVATHKPVIARVIDDHHPPPVKPSRLKNQTDEEKVKSHQVIEEASSTQAKEQHCDNDAADDAAEPPVYENIFDAVSDGAPLYENFHRVVKACTPVVVVDNSEEIVAQGNNAKPSIVGSHRKVTGKISNESGNNTVRSLRSVTPKSEKDRSNSRSRDNSMKRRGKEVLKIFKDDGTRSSQTKKLSQERKSTPTTLVTAEKNAAKTKKPVEVVYKTAVYNMKNEKLSKPTKSKEMRGPRLINELICGTKLKKPSDGKKIIKTAIVSQSNNKKRETPTTLNR